MPKKEKILVANGQGFWGDSILGPIRLVNEGPLDYLTLDYLAEVTMSIMQKLKSRDPSAGYATDFVSMVKRVLPKCREKGIKIVANAGGVNPQACRAALAKTIKELGIRGVKIGVVEGDYKYLYDATADLPVRARHDGVDGSGGSPPGLLKEKFNFCKRSFVSSSPGRARSLLSWHAISSP